MKSTMRNTKAGRCFVDGQERHFDRESPLSLLEWLREEQGLTATRRGCDSGHCGACAVVLDGTAVKSCSVLVAEAEGARVVTIEGLAGHASPSVGRLLDILRSKPVFQCGFCMSAFVFAAVDLLARTPRPSREEVRNAFDGLLCRCTGYQAIVDTVLAAASGSSDATVLHVPVLPELPAFPADPESAAPPGSSDAVR